MKKRVLISGLGAFLALVLVGYLAMPPAVHSVKGNASGDYAKLVHAKLGDTELFIPKAYLKFQHTSAGSDGALLQAWYPGGAEPPGNHSLPLIKAGEWWKNVRILVGIRPDTSIPFDTVARGATEHLHATVFAGEEYGLRHFTQAEGTNRDAYDVWFEESEGQIVSYITCGEKLTQIDVPQCSQFLYAGEEFDLLISYNRRLLPEWKTIGDNVKAMFASFHSPESAVEFLRQQTASPQPEPQEMKP